MDTITNFGDCRANGGNHVVVVHEVGGYQFYWMKKSTLRTWGMQGRRSRRRQMLCLLFGESAFGYSVADLPFLLTGSVLIFSNLSHIPVNGACIFDSIRNTAYHQAHWQSGWHSCGRSIYWGMINVWIYATSSPNIAPVCQQTFTGRRTAAWNEPTAVWIVLLLGSPACNAAWPFTTPFRQAAILAGNADDIFSANSTKFDLGVQKRPPIAVLFVNICHA